MLSREKHRLAGLCFAVGMLVGSAIVIMENIDRHRNLGKYPFRAAHDGTREVWGAILASTLTSVAVFLPVVFIEEEAGQLVIESPHILSSVVTRKIIGALPEVIKRHSVFPPGNSKKL